MERKNAWETYNAEDLQQLTDLNKSYIDFLTTCKTERECVEESVCNGEKSRICFS